MTTIQISVIALAVVSGALVGYILTMRYMLAFVGREHDKTQGHHRRLTDGYNAALSSGPRKDQQENEK